MPQPSDTEWKKYKPRQPAQVPVSFPRTQHDVVDNPALFRRLDPECLFFAFYFQPDVYQQVGGRSGQGAEGGVWGACS